MPNSSGWRANSHENNKKGESVEEGELEGEGPSAGEQENWSRGDHRRGKFLFVGLAKGI